MPIKKVFEDSNFWVAKLDPKDDLAQEALEAEAALGDRSIVTSEEVLTEVLNFFSGRGNNERIAAAKLVDKLLTSSNVEVIHQSYDSFLKGFKLYKQRTDKSFSLTDCISMNVMSNFNLSDVLTHDRHFYQAGFTLLMALR